MPFRNIRIAVIVAAICVLLAARMSIKDRIVQYVLNRIARDSLEAVDRDKLYEGALAGMTQTAADFPYTCWLPTSQQEDYERELQGQIAGIGIFNLVKDTASGEFSFVPLYDTPADRAGLRCGDRIVEVNHEPVADLSVWELVTQLRGEENTTLTLSIRDRDSLDQKAKPLREVEIVRSLIQQTIVAGDRRNADGSWNFTLEQEPDIGYLRISQFADATVPEFMSAMKSLVQQEEKISGVILDFRDNPGGFLPGAIEICKAFLGPAQTIVTTRYRNGEIKRQYVSSDAPRFTMPLVLLVDEGSASASEIVAACLQDNHRAQVVGTRSYGKGTIQELFVLPCGMGLLRLTDASFWRPNGQILHRKKTSLPTDVWGVSPDVGCDVPITDFQKMILLARRDLRAALLPDEARRAIANQDNGLTLLHKSLADAKSDKERQVILAELGIALPTPESEEKSQEPTSQGPTSQGPTSDVGTTANESNVPESATSDETVNGETVSNELPLTTGSPWAIAGKQPWYDPQLDRAVQVLRQSAPPKNNSPKNNFPKDEL